MPVRGQWLGGPVPVIAQCAGSGWSIGTSTRPSASACGPHERDERFELDHDDVDDEESPGGWRHHCVVEPAQTESCAFECVRVSAWGDWQQFANPPRLMRTALKSTEAPLPAALTKAARPVPARRAALASE